MADLIAKRTAHLWNGNLMEEAGGRLVCRAGSPLDMSVLRRLGVAISAVVAFGCVSADELPPLEAAQYRSELNKGVDVGPSVEDPRVAEYRALLELSERRVEQLVTVLTENEIEVPDPPTDADESANSPNISRMRKAELIAYMVERGAAEPDGGWDACTVAELRERALALGG